MRRCEYYARRDEVKQGYWHYFGQMTDGDMNHYPVALVEDSLGNLELVDLNANKFRFIDPLEVALLKTQ